MNDQTTYCTYCGSQNPDTFDHIPPACLFPSPRPSDLITVRSCSKCNNGASDDDEYFKIQLVMRHDVAGRPPGSRLISSVHRALAKPQKRAMLNKLVQSMNQVSVHSPSGLYLGQAATYNVDLKRFEKVINRIVKGLFLKEFDRRMPSTHLIRSFAESGFQDANFSERSNFIKFVASLNSKPGHKIGDGVFQYWYQSFPEMPDASVWLLRFFDAESFLCITLPNDITTSAA
jgi:hypothetical protein